MITQVKIYLNDAQEIQWFAQFQGIIANYRAQQSQNEIVAQPQSHTERVAEATKAVVEEHGPTLQKLADNPVVGHIQPKAEAPAAPKVTYAEMEDVVRKYLMKYGLPETRTRVQSFGVPQLDKVPEDRYAEVKAAFEGWLAE